MGLRFSMIASSPDASTFLLRMPGSKTIESFNLSKPGHELTENSVAVLPFSGGSLTVYKCRESDIPAELPLFPGPQPLPEATPRIRYDEAIRYYIANLKSMSSAGIEGKTVAARVLSAPPKAYRADLYFRLKNLYPSAYLFYLSTPETGTWMGASPELLLLREGRMLRTMALAGTRPAGTDGEWDEKNILEQRMVRDFICDVFKKHGLTVKCEPEATRNAGPVEHIVTEICAEVPEGFNLTQAAALIKELSPTPALSGFPRDIAMRMISEKETFPRHLYGGCIGRIRSNEDWCFFVNLRSALLTPRATFIYVGGGITAMSEPVKEWEETELKSITMLKAFGPGSIRVPGEPAPVISTSGRKRSGRRRKYPLN